MPRTEIPIQTLSKTGMLEPTWTAMDGANGMYFNNDGRTLLHFQNRAAAVREGVVVSVADHVFGRTGDIEDAAIDAAVGAVPGMRIVPPLHPDGWSQRGSGDLGRVFVDSSDDADLYVAAVQLPPGT